MNFSDYSKGVHTPAEIMRYLNAEEKILSAFSNDTDVAEFLKLLVNPDLSELELENQNLEEELNAAEDEIRQLKSDLADADDEISRLSEENEELELEVAQLREELEELREC